jgi:hypothetical protein
MPELVMCPACGCKVQMAESMLGQSVRCIACDNRFVAAPVPPPSPTQGRAAVPDEDEDPQARQPFCPACGKRVSWDVVTCPHCGEELEAEDEFSRQERVPPGVRRDTVPHRGAVVATLGNISMIAGGLSLCTFGLGAVISVPLGVVAWVMATYDLEQMRAGVMDPRGRAQTETGRTGGILGVVLGLLFAGFFAVMYVGR